MIFSLPWNFKSIVNDYQRDEKGYLNIVGDISSCKDESERLAIAFHTEYDISEVYRVLKKGGYFISEQLGAQNENSDKNKDFNLENEVDRLRKTGFKIIGRDQVYGTDEEREEKIHRFYFIARKA